MVGITISIMPIIIGVRVLAALLGRRIFGVAIGWLILCVLIGGCASGRVRLYEGEARPTNEVATIRIGEGVRTLRCGGIKLLSGKVGELLPGKHEITIEGDWWDRTNKMTNFIRATLTPFCLLGATGALITLPLLPTCLPLMPDKTCDCNASLDVSAGKAYEVSIDWVCIPPMLCVSESNGNTTVFTIDCVIRD